MKNAKKLRFHVFLLFHVRKHVTSSFYLKRTELTRNCTFCTNCGSQGTRIKLEQFTISCEFDPLEIKWWYHMFSSIKMEEYMEPELSGIFWVKIIAKNVVLGSSGTHVMNMRVKAKFVNSSQRYIEMKWTEKFLFRIIYLAYGIPFYLNDKLFSLALTKNIFLSFIFFPIFFRVKILIWIVKTWEIHKFMS